MQSHITKRWYFVLLIALTSQSLSGAMYVLTKWPWHQKFYLSYYGFNLICCLINFYFVITNHYNLRLIVRLWCVVNIFFEILSLVYTFHLLALHHSSADYNYNFYITRSIIRILGSFILYMFSKKVITKNSGDNEKFEDNIVLDDKI